MTLMVYDVDMVPIGLAEEFVSASWTRCVRSPSHATLVVPFGSQAAELLQIGNILMRMGDREALQIEYRHIEKAEDGTTTIEVQAFGLLKWLSRRVNLTAYDNAVTITPQEIVYELIRKNATEPDDDDRLLPIILNEREDFGQETIEYTASEYSDIESLVEEQLEAAAMNLFITTDPTEGTHTFDIREAVDKTAESDEPCIFSETFGTLGERTYVESHEEYKNFAYVKGGDDDIEAVAVGDSSGLDRREVGISASDIKKQYTDAKGQQKTQSASKVRELLAQRGETELATKYIAEQTMDGEIIQSEGLKYLEDYDVGDRVTIMDEEWGVRVDATITEISEEMDENGFVKIRATFGEGTPSISRSIKAAISRL